MDYYLAYESYFAGLLFYEYRGIQIYVEALNHRDPTGQTADTYISQYYTPNLRDEVDRFLIGCASMGMADGGVAARQVADHVMPSYLAPIEYRVFPRSPLAPADPEAAPPKHDAEALVPPLLRAYLRLQLRFRHQLRDQTRWRGASRQPELQHP